MKNDELRSWLNEKCVVQTKIEKKGTCPICFDENVELHTNYCGHSMCIECFKNEIQTQISQMKYPVVCRIDNCNSEILIDDIERFLGQEEAEKYYSKYIEKQMALSNEFIKCPAPDCPKYLKRETFGLCDFGQCECGKAICLKCRQDTHAPLTCEQVQKWEQICEEMNQLWNAQNEWERRELRLWRYRKNHVDEIKKVLDDLINLMVDENEEIEKKEADEIKEL